MPATAERAPGRRLCRLPIADIARSPHQPRRLFSDESIRALAESIRRYGLLSPIVVRADAQGNCELVAGERRLRALTELGATQVDALMLPAPEQEAALLSLIENLQREPLHYLEEAESYQALIAAYGFTQQELARKLSISQPCVANRLRLLRLPGDVREQLLVSPLSERHARALLPLRDETLLRFALQRAVDERMSVKRLEAFVAKLVAGGARKPGVRLCLRDRRVLINAVLNAVREMNRAGVPAEARVLERDDRTEIVVALPRSWNA